MRVSLCCLYWKEISRNCETDEGTPCFKMFQSLTKSKDTTLAISLLFIFCANDKNCNNAKLETSCEVFDDCPREQAPWGKERLTSWIARGAGDTDFYFADGITLLTN